RIGAAWTYGNGNLGFSHNATRTVVQLEVIDRASASPTFVVIATSPGPISTNNDGAAIPEGPTDLGVSNIGPSTSMGGGTGNYTLTVTNHGPNDSCGFVVTDVLPSALINPTSPDPNGTVIGSTVTCVGGVLLSGATQAFTVQAQVHPAFVDG